MSKFTWALVLAATHTFYHEKAWHEMLKLTLLKYYSSQHKRLSWGTLRACLLPCQIKEVKQYQKGRDEATWPRNRFPAQKKKMGRVSLSTIKSHQRQIYKYFTNILYPAKWTDMPFLLAQHASGVKLSPRAISSSFSSMWTLMLTKEKKILFSRPLLGTVKATGI